MALISERFDQIRDLWEIQEECGYPSASLDPWISRFGAVPEALAVYYTTLGAHRELNETQDALVVPDDAAEGYHRLADVPDSDHLIFYVENQWGCVWGVRPSAVGQPDPPVHLSFDAAEWSPTGESVSEFLLAQAHMQRVMSFEFNSETFYEFTASALERVAANFPLLAVTKLGAGTDFYGDRDAIVLVAREDDDVALGGSAGGHVWFGATDENRFDSLLDSLNTIGNILT